MSEIEECVKTIVELEGLSFEEAKLSYAARQKLPDSAFCGPNRSYPTHDAAHVRNGLARLGTFGGRLKPAVRARILGCLKSRAKKYGIEVSETVDGRICLAKWDEELSKEQREKMLREIEETQSWFEQVQEQVGRDNYAYQHFVEVHVLGDVILL